MYFGPVGHTANGNDAVHSVQNQIAGNFDSITLADLFRSFYFAWTCDRTRPQPIILDTQYDWVQHQVLLDVHSLLPPVMLKELLGFQVVRPQKTRQVLT